jgi:PHD/YefM family antitoxin component YafN of YafNO toxin-antitoxin module
LIDGERTMLKVKPEYLSKRGRREFVVLTVEDFERMQAALEDAQDLRTLREATRKNAKAPYLTSEEVDRRLAPRSTRKRKAS